MIIELILAFVLMTGFVYLIIPASTERQPERQRRPIAEGQTEERKLSDIPEQTNEVNDAIAGLVNLGYPRRDAKSRVLRAWGLLGHTDTEKLIKKAMVI